MSLLRKFAALRPRDEGLSLVSLRFREPEVERAYAEFDAESDMAPARSILAVVALFVLVDPLWWVFVRGFAFDRYCAVELMLGALCAGLFLDTYRPWSIRNRRVLAPLGVFMIVCGQAGLVAAVGVTFQRTFFASPMLTMFSMAPLPFGWRLKAAFNVALYALTEAWVDTSGLFSEPELVSITNLLTFTTIFATALAYIHELNRRRRFVAERRSDEILFNVLPEPVARRLKGAPGQRVVDRVEEAVVLFVDIVGFTPFAAERSADEVVETLERLFERFDVICAQHGLEKIKTIGDAYMAVAGVPSPHPRAAQAVADAALDMLACARRLQALGGLTLEVRIGLHLGPVVAGVIGRSRFLFDLWGDTVNVAARLEATSLPGQIQVSAEVARALGAGYHVEPRGLVALKGRGEVETYLLLPPRVDAGREAS